MYRNINGDSAFLLAALKGQTAICEMLLSAGCEVNETNSLGETALMNAVMNNHPDLVRFLMDQPGRCTHN